VNAAAALQQSYRSTKENWWQWNHAAVELVLATVTGPNICQSLEAVQVTLSLQANLSSCDVDTLIHLLWTVKVPGLLQCPLGMDLLNIL